MIRFTEPWLLYLLRQLIAGLPCMLGVHLNVEQSWTPGWQRCKNCDQRWEKLQ